MNQEPQFTGLTAHRRPLAEAGLHTPTSGSLPLGHVVTAKVKYPWHPNKQVKGSTPCL